MFSRKGRQAHGITETVRRDVKQASHSNMHWNDSKYHPLFVSGLLTVPANPKSQCEWLSDHILTVLTSAMTPRALPGSRIRNRRRHPSNTQRASQVQTCGDIRTRRHTETEAEIQLALSPSRTILTSGYPTLALTLLPRWPSGQGVRLGSGRSRVRIQLAAGLFSGSSHTSDLKTGTPVATLLGAWCCRVIAGTGWPGFIMLWLGEMESLVWNSSSVWQSVELSEPIKHQYFRHWQGLETPSGHMKTSWLQWKDASWSGTGTSHDHLDWLRLSHREHYTGGRRRGRQRKRWEDNIKEWTGPWMEGHTAESWEPQGVENVGCRIYSGAPTASQTTR